MTREKKMHENQRLGRRTRSDCAAQPGALGTGAQSTDAADVTAAAQLPRLNSAPEDLVSLCFVWKIELNNETMTSVERSGRLARFASRQFVPKVHADYGRQGQSTHIGKETRQRAAT
jgi:hypothetical protein